MGAFFMLEFSSCVVNNVACDLKGKGCKGECFTYCDL